MSLIRRRLTAAQLAANRRNAKKSTGPRTPEGKRRAALNSLKKSLCPHWRALLIPLKGQNPRDYKGLHRDLIAMLEPDNSFFRALVRDLVESWWEKLCWLRGEILGPTGPAMRDKFDLEIESRLTRYLTALSLHKRKWNAWLVCALGAPISSPAMLRERMEVRLAAFHTSNGIIQVVNGPEEPENTEKCAPPKNAIPVTHRQIRGLAKVAEKTNPTHISP